MELNNLYVLLQTNGIDTNMFSIGRAKSVKQLHQEILLGETRLITDNNRLIREVDALYLIIKSQIQKF